MPIQATYALLSGALHDAVTIDHSPGLGRGAAAAVSTTAGLLLRLKNLPNGRCRREATRWHRLAGWWPICGRAITRRRRSDP